MRKNLSLLAATLLVAAPAFAVTHPDAYQDGTNSSGNAIWCVTSFLTGTTFCINNVDGAGVGFNDPTADAAAVGGNDGTTIGEKRLNAYMESFRIWSDQLSTNEVVWVQATFSPLACTATSGALGGAQTIQIFANFDDDGGPSWPFTWYHAALANRLADEDLESGGPDPGFLQPPFADDIFSIFNSELGETDCLEDLSWYYGYDGGEDPDTEIDFLAVLTHEVNHGLGFANFVDEGCIGGSNASGCQPPGSMPNGWPDIYTVFSRDWNTQMHWNQMNDGVRATSAVADELVWDGPNVYAAAPGWLEAGSAVVENSPDSELFRAQQASYGPPPTAVPVTADVVLYDDGVGDPNDACDCPVVGTGLCLNLAPLPTNLTGKIALINRGSCAFVLKSALAQFAGAVGVVIANNVPAGLPGMGGSELTTMTIPSVGIAQSAGNTLKADIAGGTTNASIVKDETISGLAGADRDGFPRLYAPNPVSPGSSVSHWDTTLTPNALMEPFISDDLDVGTTLDLSPAQLTDVGWDGNLYCPVGSDDTEGNLTIDGCDTGIANSFGPWTLVGGIAGPRGQGWKTTGSTVNGGCYLADLLNSCGVLHAGTHGDYVNCVGAMANGLRKLSAISPAEADSLKACAEAAAIP